MRQPRPVAGAWRNKNRPTSEQNWQAEDGEDVWRHVNKNYENNNGKRIKMATVARTATSSASNTAEWLPVASPLDMKTPQYFSYHKKV